MVPAPSMGKAPWRFVLYVDPSGTCQVHELFKSITGQDAKILIRLQQVLLPSIALDPFAAGPPQWKGLGDGLYQVRSGVCRLYCSLESHRRIMVYRAVLKRFEKFDPADKKACLKGIADVQSAAYDEEQRTYLCKAKYSPAPITAIN
jgi:hypothetical protein